MNIVLSMVLTNEMDTKTPPYCLLMLAAMVEPTEHNVRIVFPLELDNFIGDPKNIENIDVFGLSINSFNWYSTKKVIKKVHEINNKTKIILGGAHATHLHEHCLKATEAHIVCRGESEITFKQLLNAFKNNSAINTIEGISYKDTNGDIHVNDDRPIMNEDELNALPLPAYHLIPKGVYTYVPVETSRGCPHKCIFCCHPFSSEHRLFSLKRIESVLKTVAKIEDRFLDRAIFFSDDSFCNSKAHTMGVLKMTKEIVPDFSIGCEARMFDILKHNLVSELEKIRLFMIQVGVECGYKEGLLLTRKGLTIEQANAFADAISKTNFRDIIFWSFIIGFPWEKEEQIIKTINFAFTCAFKTVSRAPQINNFAPYPGTSVYKASTDASNEIPPIDFWDSPDWYKQFLGRTKISMENRKYLLEYLKKCYEEYPNFTLNSVHHFPDGLIVDLSE